MEMNRGFVNILTHHKYLQVYIYVMLTLSS